MAKTYDAIVIGGGHNGLTAAAYLARAGLQTLVVERRHLVGGAAVTEELLPGFKFSVCSYVVSLLRPEIIRDLNLPKHGLEILPLDSTLTPLPDGRYLFRGPDHGETYRHLCQFSHKDAEAYDRFSRKMYDVAKSVKPLLSWIPPDPTSLNPANLRHLWDIGKYFLGLGDKTLYLLHKMMTLSAGDFLDGWFETDVLKATLSASGIIGTFLGPRSPGTAYVMLHHYMGEIDGAYRAWGFAKGGTGAISNAIAGAALECGAEIRVSAPATELLVQRGKVTGVVLEGGEEIRAKTIVSGLDPWNTFLKLVPKGSLDEDFLTSVRRIKFRGSSGKVNLALSELPKLSCLPNGSDVPLRGAISISPSLDYLERAYDDAKYGRFSRKPYMDIILPSMIDPDMAPPGQHVMSIFCQYAPYQLSEGDWDGQREAFGDAVIDTLEEYMPNLRKIILHRQVVTPLDLERTFGLSQGNIFQGELLLEQLFFLRPVPAWATYRTPLEGLYMCGSCTHPGGGIMGASGLTAAREILKDLKK